MAKALLLGHAAFMILISNVSSYLAVTNVAVNKCANKDALESQLGFALFGAGVFGLIARQLMFFSESMFPSLGIDLADTWTTYPPHHIFLSVFVSIVFVFAAIFLDTMVQDGPRMTNICRNMKVLSLSRFSKNKIKGINTHEEFYQRLEKMHNKFCSNTKVEGTMDTVGVCITSDPTKEDFDEYDVIDKYYVSKFKEDIETFEKALNDFNAGDANEFEKHNKYLDADVHKNNQQKFNWLKSTGITIMGKIPVEDVPRYDAYNSENCELLRMFDELKGKIEGVGDKAALYGQMIAEAPDYSGARKIINDAIKGSATLYQQAAAKQVVEKLAVDGTESNNLVKVIMFYVHAYSKDDNTYKTLFKTDRAELQTLQAAVDEAKLELANKESQLQLLIGQKSNGAQDVDTSTTKTALDKAKENYDAAVKALGPTPDTPAKILDQKIADINKFVVTDKNKTGVDLIDNNKLAASWGTPNPVRCDDGAFADEKFKKLTFVMSSTDSKKYYNTLGPYYYQKRITSIKNYRERLQKLFDGDMRTKVVTNYKKCEDDYLRRNIINGYTWVMIMWPSIELYSAIANVKTALFRDNQTMTFVFMGASIVLPVVYGVMLYGGAGIAQGSAVFTNILSSAKEIVQKVIKVNTDIGSYTFDVSEETTVGEIKKSILENEDGIKWNEYGLHYNETILTDDAQTLADLKIGFGSTLTVRKITVTTGA